MASLKRWLDRRRNPWKAEFHEAFLRFRKDGANALFQSYSDLPAGATVLDFGGYEGEWTHTVLRQQPEATVHVFEPHPGFAAALRSTFHADPRVHVHELALGGADGTLGLSDRGDASSAVADHDAVHTAPVVEAARFFEQENLTDVALVKINIEGGEYDLLPALIGSGLMKRIDRLQVQFHLFSPDLMPERDQIRAGLAQTHHCTLCYPFVWEEWRRT